MPRGPAQERLIRDALARAGVSPSEVDYLEAHGTGTELGDSIELRAVAAVYGEDRDPERPLLLGSVKSNIGHSEWAAGMAGLIKAVLAMKRGVIPAHLHFRDPNPNLDWDRMPVRVTSEMTPWPALPNRRPLSGVHSFGLSGTNSHVILEGYEDRADGSEADDGTIWPAGKPATVEPPVPTPLKGLALPQGDIGDRGSRLLPLSGKSPDALRELAEAYLAWLEDPTTSLHMGEAGRPLLADMAWTAGVGRSHFPCRSGIVFQDAAELRTKLKELAGSHEEFQPLEKPDLVNVAFVYSGLDLLEAGVGRCLYRTEPIFRAVLDSCDQVIREERGASLLDVMFGSPGAAGYLQDPAWANSAIYAMEAALTALWGSIGVRPDKVLGKGIGEVPAALAAGGFGLDEGCRLAASIGSAELALPEMKAPSVTFISNVTQRVVQPTDDLGEDHWRRLTDDDDAFQRSMNVLAASGADLVIEIGPHAGTDASVSSLWPRDPDGAPGPVFIESPLTPGDALGGEERSFLEGVAAAYEAGARISFAGLFAGEKRRRIGIPSYPFQRRRFWVQASNRSR